MSKSRPKRNSFSSFRERYLGEASVEVSVGDRVVGTFDDSDRKRFNRTFDALRKKVSQAKLDTFLDGYFKQKGFSGEGVSRMKNAVLSAYEKTSKGFDIDGMVEALSSPYPIGELDEGNGYIDKITSAFLVPRDFVISLFKQTPMTSSSKRLDMGELLLGLFTDLKRSPAFDFVSPDGETIDVKDVKDKGFEISNDGKTPEMIHELLSEEVRSIPSLGKEGLNMSFLEELHKQFKESMDRGGDVNVGVIAKAFCPFTDVYEDEKSVMDDITEEVLNEDVARNANNDFRSFVACLQVYGYLKGSMGLDKLAIFYDNRGDYRKRVHSIEPSTGFKEFFDSYGRKSSGKTYLWTEGAWGNRRDSFGIGLRPGKE